MSSIDAEIVAWANGRSAWQRALLHRLSRGEQFGDDRYEEIAAALCADTQHAEGELLTIADLTATNAASARRVALISVGNLLGINALASGQTLSFGEHGLTIVYGDNACGKSGYARVIKNMVFARHRDQVILPDVFNPSSEASAAIAFMTERGTRQVAWPTANDPDLSSVRFFDDACREAYVTKEADTTYRPVALHLLEALIRVLDGVRAVLDARARQIQLPVATLPRLAEGTPGAAFLAGLTGQSSTSEIDAACALRADADEEIQKLRVEEGRLLVTDPDKERESLSRRASELEEVYTHLALCEQAVSNDIEARLHRLRNELAAKTAAAAAASMPFTDEAVHGVGSEAWRALWEAARTFAAAQTSDLRTPCAVNNYCVLCQQALPAEAQARLSRFEAFVADETQRQLLESRSALQSALNTVAAVESMPPTMHSIFERLTVTHRELIAKCVNLLNVVAARRGALIEAVTAPQLSAEPLLQELRDAAAQAKNLAAEVPAEGFAHRIALLRSQRDALEARKLLSERRAAIVEEVQRLNALARIERAKTEASTNAISRKATELTRTYVTDVMRDRFTRETDRLRLERLTLKDAGGQKGTVRHQPALLGAVQKASLPQVLSEGEQTALGLAGFFTEAALDQSRSAIVLDDPVSSLDHIRRGNVANRLCEFAGERQVIVFTHDLAFVADLLASAERLGVDVVERAIERRGTKEPGVCRDKHPWKAKDAASRLSDLQADLARMRRAEASWDQDTREREIAEWAGCLSETWERLINHDVAGQVMDRGSQEVRPSMFRVFARITERDDNEFQTSYATVSRWARRHDKSVALNYVPPALDEMQEELTRVTAWFKRVKKYREA